MRWIVASLIVLVGLLTPRGVVANAACKGGKVVFRVTMTPKSSASEDQRRERWEVRSSGAWRHVVDDVEQTAGCLTRPDLKVFLTAVTRARFRSVATAGSGACIRAPERTMTYAAPQRRKRVTVEVPCGGFVDRQTAILQECLWAAMDPQQAPADVSATCQGQ